MQRSHRNEQEQRITEGTDPSREGSDDDVEQNRGGSSSRRVRGRGGIRRGATAVISSVEAITTAGGHKRARQERGRSSASSLPDRFYCPHPHCKRSFQDLWRLRVHYRADPDARGSGKERGHGVELPFCPKCLAPINPGKKHMVCKTTEQARVEESRHGSRARPGSSPSHPHLSVEADDRDNPAVAAAAMPSPAARSSPPHRSQQVASMVSDVDLRVRQQQLVRPTLLEELAVVRHHNSRADNNSSPPFSSYHQQQRRLQPVRELSSEDSGLMLLARRAAIHQFAAEQRAQTEVVQQARALSALSATDYDLASRYAAAAAGLWASAAPAAAGGAFVGGASPHHRFLSQPPSAINFSSAHHHQHQGGSFSPQQYQSMMLQMQQQLLPQPPRGSNHSDEDALSTAFRAAGQQQPPPQPLCCYSPGGMSSRPYQQRSPSPEQTTSPQHQRRPRDL